MGCVLIRNCIPLWLLGMHCQVHKLAHHGTGVTHLYALGDAIGGHTDDNIGEVVDVAQFFLRDPIATTTCVILKGI